MTIMSTQIPRKFKDARWRALRAKTAIAGEAPPAAFPPSTGPAKQDTGAPSGRDNRVDLMPGGLADSRQPREFDTRAPDGEKNHGAPAGLDDDSFSVFMDALKIVLVEESKTPGGALDARTAINIAAEEAREHGADISDEQIVGLVDFYASKIKAMPDRGVAACEAALTTEARSTAESTDAEFESFEVQVGDDVGLYHVMFTIEYEIDPAQKGSGPSMENAGGEPSYPASLSWGTPEIKKVWRVKSASDFPAEPGAKVAPEEQVTDAAELAAVQVELENEFDHNGDWARDLAYDIMSSSQDDRDDPRAEPEYWQDR